MSSDELPPGKWKDYVISFCRILQNLALELTEHFPDDAATARAQKRIILAIKEFPLWIANDVGKGLFKYRDQIYDRNTDFFLLSTFDEERAQAFRDDPEKGKLTDHLIPKVKSAWADSGPDQQDKYLSLMTDLLDAYVDFKILQKARP